MNQRESTGFRQTVYGRKDINAPFRQQNEVKRSAIFEKNPKDDSFMKNFLNADKGFYISTESYYAPIFQGENPNIMIGFYNEDYGTKGEFKIEWNDIGIQLKAYDDSWEALSHMPELIELLAKISRDELNCSIKEFAEELKKLGYKDNTKREKS